MLSGTKFLNDYYFGQDPFESFDVKYHQGHDHSYQ
jgi:hypothetical protein